MKLLSKRHILMLHHDLIQNYGGTEGMRDESLLDSAVNSPLQSFAGVDLYPTLLEKAVRLGFGLIKNHPMLDGNKRLGAHSMLTLLRINGVSLHWDQEDLINITLGIASGEKQYEDLLQWIISHQS